jgi:quercetin dioxygenase-like cupin family protein
MPIVKSEDAPEFDLAGVRVRGLSAPSRGALETMSYLVELGPGQRLPEHTHDHEEVFHVLSGPITVSLDGAETLLGPGDTVMVPPGVSHFSYAGESLATAILAMMPVGTIMIRPGGERVAPPWGV